MDGHGNWKGESMFHLKCPICGGLLNEFEDGTYEFYAVGCSQCEWQTFEYSSSIEAWSKAEQLVSKFPSSKEVGQRETSTNRDCSTCKYQHYPVADRKMPCEECVGPYDITPFYWEPRKEEENETDT